MEKNSNTSSINAYPNVRLRRLRTTPAIRDLLQETRLSHKDLIAPVIVHEGLKRPVENASMPDIHMFPLSRLVAEVERNADLGITAVILFGLPSHKDAEATSAFDNKGIVQKSVELLRKQFGSRLAIITDVCLCQYTAHGHCGLLVEIGRAHV